MALAAAGSASAESAAHYQAAQPQHFHAETGYRIARYRAPTPDDIPHAIRVDAERARALLARGALAIDVLAASQSRYDDLDGTWLVSEPRLSLPGAVWLPETGRGTLTPVMARYLAENLERLTGGDASRPILVFCIADCWMSWNAAQRIHGLGYSAVHWFAEGTDGWLDMGWELSPTDPVPVVLD